MDPNKITINSIGVNGQKYHYVQNGETLCGVERHRRGTQRSTRRINQEHPGSVVTCESCKRIYADRVEPIVQAKAPDASNETILRAIRLILTGEIDQPYVDTFTLIQTKPNTQTLEEAWQVAERELTAINPRIKILGMGEGNTAYEFGGRKHIWVRFIIGPVQPAAEPVPAPPQAYSLWKSTGGQWTVWLPFSTRKQAEGALATYRETYQSVRWEIAPTFPSDVEIKLPAAPSTYAQWPPDLTEKQPESQQSMTEKAIEIRAGYIEKWLREGISPEKIKEWAADPVKRSLINAMAMFDADEAFKSTFRYTRKFD